ncbi:MAG: aldo/keto reductase [Cyclobacteriaceae bacterium]
MRYIRQMNYRQLGKSGIFVTDLCLGTMIFGETEGRGTPAKEASAMIRAYIDAGGNHVDTANVYAGGESERITGKAIKADRADIILASKVNFPTLKGINNFGLSRRNIINSVHDSLGRLDTDYIDLLYVHCWDQYTPLEESLRALDDLVTAGKVRYIGVSNFKAWQLMKGLAMSDSNLWSRFIAAQYQYSLVKRDVEYEFSDLLLSENVGMVPWGPLGGGFLSGKYKKDQRPEDFGDGRIGGTPDGNEESWERRNTERNWQIIEAVGQVAEELDATYSQVALAWLLAQSTVASVIIGVRTMEQLTDNIGASALKLSVSHLELLNQASELPELYPYRMIQAYGRKV